MTTWERHERKKFARQVEPGKRYYTIETAVYPWGEEKVWRPWVFTERQWITGNWMSGAVSAEGACLRNGPMYDTKPGPHIRPMFECDEEAMNATPADIVKVRNSRGKKPARR